MAIELFIVDSIKVTTVVYSIPFDYSLIYYFYFKIMGLCLILLAETLVYIMVLALYLKK